jgi:hypothetical protein
LIRFRHKLLPYASLESPEPNLTAKNAAKQEATNGLGALQAKDTWAIVLQPVALEPPEGPAENILHEFRALDFHSSLARATGVCPRNNAL